MSAQPGITPDERRELEAIYRQQIGAVRALARLLGYPCPIASRAERQHPIDDRGTLELAQDGASVRPHSGC